MSQLDTIYECTLRQAKEYVYDAMAAGLVPFIKSSPGMGKSAMLAGVASECNLHLIDHRLSTSSPVDLTGLPGFVDGMARFHPFDDTFPVESTPVPADKDGFMLFLDEFNSAPKSVQAACYKLILDRKIGQHNLHPHTAIVLAGNLATDRAIVTELSTAMQSRVIHLKIRTDFKEFMEDVALPQKWDSRIVAYLNWKNAALNDFDPDHSNDTFCCQRTWDFMNRLIKDKPVLDSKLPLYVGTISPGTAVDFVQFTKVYTNLPNITRVVSDPQGTAVPQDTATKWAVITHLAEKVDDQTFSAICTYIDRFSIEFRLLFYRTVASQMPQMRSHPAFTKAMGDLSRYLHAA